MRNERSYMRLEHEGLISLVDWNYGICSLNSLVCVQPHLATALRVRLSI